MTLDAHITRLIPYADDSDFSLANLPYGIYSTASKTRRVGVAIGEGILDMAQLYELDLFNDIDTLAENVFDKTTLNDFIKTGSATWTLVRKKIIQVLTLPEQTIQKNITRLFDLQSTATMHLPVQIFNYTDFYSSEAHATHVGKLFRPHGEPLLPNWKHLPVAYHGRASSITLSGSMVTRPQGQYLKENAPVFGLTQELDFELELGYIVGRENQLGHPIAIAEANEYVFGAVILNDWSARDIQRWEYQPLGPFLGKNFATSISPWVVTMEALKPFRVDLLSTQSPAVLDYLKDPRPQVLDLDLHVAMSIPDHAPVTITRSNSKYLYWTLAQQIAHHTINGCNLLVGDILATGTISGWEEASCGSLLEMTHNGSRPLTIADQKRTYLQDGDGITMLCNGRRPGINLGFGPLMNKIVANPYTPYTSI